MSKFILAYVNMPDTEHNLDREFETIIKLMAFVNQEYPGHTSYGITVLASSKAD